MGAERLAATLNGLPLFLDDSREAKAKLVDAIIYGLANGQGRTRGSKLGRAKTSSWQTILISNGESPLTHLSNDHRGGRNVRILNLCDPPYGKPNAKTLALLKTLDIQTKHNYGLAGPEFVRFLLSNQSRWPEWVAEYERRALSYLTTVTGEAARMADHCAVISLTLDLSKEAGVIPPEWGDPIPALWPQIEKSLAQAAPHVQALFDIYEWANSHSAHFFGQLDFDKRKPLYGDWQADWKEINILPNVCK